jgi:predicted RNA-binding Zn ribbon-like protein
VEDEGVRVYDEPMATDRDPQPVHPRNRQNPAPGDLELVRSFLALHDHEPGSSDSLPPSAESLAWWLRGNGELADDRPVSDEDLAWVRSIWDAMRTKVLENMGAPPDEAATETLNAAAHETGLRVCFGCDEDDRLHADSAGVRGAVGRLLGVAFLAQLEGTWERFRLCDDPGCRTVFYDRSKNHSGRWCSMRSCGNRAKVRAFRERRAAEV